MEEDIDTVKVEVKGLRKAVSVIWQRLKNVLPFLFGRVNTGRLKATNLLHSLLFRHFSLSELEQLVFEIGIDAETLGHDENDKDALIRGIISRALKDTRLLRRLMSAVKEERPFVAWPDIE